jgi:hypothetical protein
MVHKQEEGNGNDSVNRDWTPSQKLFGEFLEDENTKKYRSFSTVRVSGTELPICSRFVTSR